MAVLFQFLHVVSIVSFLLSLLLAVSSRRQLLAAAKGLAGSLWQRAQSSLWGTPAGFVPKIFQQQRLKVMQEMHIECFRNLAKWFLAFHAVYGLVIAIHKESLRGLNFHILFLNFMPVQCICFASAFFPVLVSVKTISVAQTLFYVFLIVLTWTAHLVFSCETPCAEVPFFTLTAVARAWVSLMMAGSGALQTILLDLAWTVSFMSAGIGSQRHYSMLWWSRSTTAFLFVAATASWRKIHVSLLASDLLQAKAASRLDLSMKTLLAKVCDATVELDGDGIVVGPSPKLAALLMRGASAAEACKGRAFLDYVLEADKGRVEQHFQAAAEELRAMHGVAGLAARELQTRLVDAGALLVRVHLFHVCFLGIDEGPRHMVGIVEVSDDYQQQFQQHEQQLFPLESFGDASSRIAPALHQCRQVPPVDDDMRPLSASSDSQNDRVSCGNETASEAGSSSSLTSASDEPCMTSCWVLPGSQDWTIVHTTLRFTLAWRTEVPKVLRQLTRNKYEKFAARALEVTSDKDFMGLAVELRNMRLHPLRSKSQQLQVQALLRFWKSRAAEDVEELPEDRRQLLAPGEQVVRVDMENYRWTHSTSSRYPSVHLLRESPNTVVVHL